MENSDPAFFEKIEAYLAGKLSGEENTKMESAIAADETLAREVALRRAEFEIAENLIANEIRQQLSGLREKSKVPPPEKHWKIWLAGLAVCLAAVAFFWKFCAGRPENLPEQKLPNPPNRDSQLIDNQNVAPTPPPEKNSKTPKPQTPDPRPKKQIALAKSFYEKPHFSNLRGGGSQNEASLETAFSAFEKGDFSGAVSLLENFPTGDPQFWKSQNLLAHAYFSMGDFSASARVFQKISESKTQPFAEEADWFLLLARLAAGDWRGGDFLKKLEAIATDAGHPFSVPAKNLKVKMIETMKW